MTFNLQHATTIKIKISYKTQKTNLEEETTGARATGDGKDGTGGEMDSPSERRAP